MVKSTVPVTIMERATTRHEHCDPEWDEGARVLRRPGDGRVRGLPLRPIYIRHVTLFTRATWLGEVAMSHWTRFANHVCLSFWLTEEMGQPKPTSKGREAL